MIFVLLLSAAVSGFAAPALAAGEGPDGVELFLDPARILASIPPPVTRKEFSALHLTWPAEARDRAARDAGFRRAAALDRYGLWEAREPGRPAGGWSAPPFGVKRDRKGQWHWDCLSCHAGPVPGYRDGRVTQSIAIGAPNIHLDFASYVDDRIRLNRSPGLRRKAGLGPGYYYGLGSRMGAGIQMEFYKRFQAVYGGGSASRGTLTLWPTAAGALELGSGDPSPTPWESVAAFGRLFRKGGLRFFGTRSADTDIPAWWNTAVKDHVYADGFAPKSPWITHLGAINLDRKKMRKLQDSGEAARMVRAFGAMPAPRWPDAELPAEWRIDRALAEAGREVFARACARCHGTYGRDSEGRTTVAYPNLRQVPQAVLQSDPLRLEAGMTPALRRAIRESLFGIEAERGAVSDAGRIDTDPVGYTPPPLVGVWATRPYLHNGSVPTLEDLLGPEEARPRIWEAVRFERDGATVYDYDFAKAGLGYRVWTEEELAAEKDPERRRRVFDSRLPGKSVSGHGRVFDSVLEPHGTAEGRGNRKAVLEYLKTL